MTYARLKHLCPTYNVPTEYEEMLMTEFNAVLSEEALPASEWEISKPGLSSYGLGYALVHKHSGEYIQIQKRTLQDLSTLSVCVCRKLGSGYTTKEFVAGINQKALEAAIKDSLLFLWGVQR